VTQLEILLLLRAMPARSWSASEVNVALGLKGGAAETALETLSCRSLLDVRLGTDLRYRFAPPAADAEVIDAVADLHQRMPASIAGIVTAGQG
jgi:hypothetical protein